MRGKIFVVRETRFRWKLQICSHIFYYTWISNIKLGLINKKGHIKASSNDMPPPLFRLWKRAAQEGGRRGRLEESRYEKYYIEESSVVVNQFGMKFQHNIWR